MSIDFLKKFVFNVRDREQTIYDATQSVAREVISKRQLASILTSGRGEIEEEIKKLLQEMLNYYDMGVNILVVQMLKIDPPAQVIDSFRDVQTARVDKESEINKAYKYKNDILPKVRGEAGKMIEDANGYAIAVVNRAKGDASRFNQVYEQYKNAPFVTRKKMYLDAMEELFSKNKITIVDENVKNVFLDSKTKVKVDNKYNITINVNNKSSLNEYNCGNKINKNKLEKDTNKKIKKYINKAIKKQEKSNSEFLGLKRYIYLKYPKYKNEEYKVKIKVNTKITRTGEINKSSKGEKNENK